MRKRQTVGDLIELLRHYDPALPAYFGEFSRVHEREHYTPIKLALEPVIHDSQGYPYPPRILTTDVRPEGESAPLDPQALIIRKDFKL